MKSSGPSVYWKDTYAEELTKVHGFSVGTGDGSGVVDGSGVGILDVGSWLGDGVVGSGLGTGVDGTGVGRGLGCCVIEGAGVGSLVIR